MNFYLAWWLLRARREVASGPIQDGCLVFALGVKTSLCSLARQSHMVAQVPSCLNGLGLGGSMWAVSLWGH